MTLPVVAFNKSRSGVEVATANALEELNVFDVAVMDKGDLQGDCY